MKLAKKIQTFQLTSTALRAWGLLFLAAGLFGNLIQARLLGVGSMSNSELFDALQAEPGLMAYATIALVGQALEACALPLFSFLLIEGAVHTGSFGRYFLRVLGLAAVCQLPYHLAMTGSLLRFPGWNPVFALLLSMVMLYFFRRYPGKTAGHIAVKCFAILFAYLWSNILGVAHGAACVILTAVLWALRGKQNLQTVLGVLAMLCCVIFSPFYMIAPVSFLLLYFYDGKQGSHSRLVNYAAYPVLLLIFGLIRAFS